MNVYERFSTLLTKLLHTDVGRKGKTSLKDSQETINVAAEGQEEFQVLSSSQESKDSREESTEKPANDPPVANKLDKCIAYNKRNKEDSCQSCLCSSDAKARCVLHNVFMGEQVPRKENIFAAVPRDLNRSLCQQVIYECAPLASNYDALRCYQVSITPSINFKAEFPTRIEHDGKIYEFKGYFILSHFSLRKIPKCHFSMYKRKYLIELKGVSMPKNFFIKDLDLFHELVFENYFEIYDWNIRVHQNRCRLFHFLPRFVCTGNRKRKHGSDTSCRDNGEKLLPMKTVLEYLLSSHEPLVKARHLSRNRSYWNEKGAKMKDSLVLFPGKRPPCIRVDGLDLESRSRSDESFPVILHHAKPTAVTSSSRRLEWLKRKKDDLQSIQEDCVLPDESISRRLHSIEQEIKSLKGRDTSKSIATRISTKGCFTTGIKNDMFQHFLALYIAVNHIRYHKSLGLLEERIGYIFNDKDILEKSLSHVSISNKVGTFNNITVSSSNCGPHKIYYGSESRVHRRKRGLEKLHGTISKLAESESRTSTISHNESLEFLGDAILEYITTKRLFFMFGKKSEGELSQFRSLLVENAHFADIAKRLQLKDFMRFGHCCWKPATSDRILANCFEALLAAVYVDGGLAEAENIVKSLYFEEKDLQEIWMDIPKHDLQERAPDGDRQLIPDSPRLQHLVQLEDQLGLQFTHISLLARAFTCQADSEDALTCGNNQTLEFLGDSVLKFIVSDYVYWHFPDHQEGHLTLLRTSLVNANTQATLFKELGLDKFIDEDSLSMMTPNVKFYANFFEAFIGAVYVDKGIEYCRKICEVALFPRLETFILNRGLIDPKSELQNCCSYLRGNKNEHENPVYRLLEATGPIPFRRYKAAVFFKNEQIGVGTGVTIRAAEVAAARDALDSNYFEIAEKQKRLLCRKYGSKTLEQTSKKEENIVETGNKNELNNIEDWEPVWIDL